MHHTERLARVGWRGESFVACGDSRGRESRCRMIDRAGAAAVAAASPPAGYADDASPPDRAPGACRVRFDDVPGDPGAPAARATLVGPAGAQPLDAWRPAREVDGDYFAVETSFSPDGKWLALVHTAVGIGEDERRVEVAGAEVRAAPACR